MDKSRIEIEDKERQIAGLKDGGKITITCSACRKDLMLVWITKPDAKVNGKDVEWNIKCKCCYCNDWSYMKKIKGGFHHAGIGIPTNDPETDIPVTVVESVEIDRKQNCVLFTTKKV